MYGVVPAWGGLCDQRGALPKCVGLQAMCEGMRYSVAACNSKVWQ